MAFFTRLRLVVTPEFAHLYKSRELQPAPVGETLRLEGRTMLLGAFAPLASFAMFHLVTMFPLSRSVLFKHEAPERFLVVEMIGAYRGFAPTRAGNAGPGRRGRHQGWPGAVYLSRMEAARGRIGVVAGAGDTVRGGTPATALAGPGPRTAPTHCEELT